MVLTEANRLRSNTNNHIIKENVNEILSLINDKITREHRMGQTKIIFELPITFRQLTCDIDTTKIMIYYSVLSSLITAGYDAKIKLDIAIPLISIKWKSGINDYEINSMRKFLQEHSI